MAAGLALRVLLLLAVLPDRTTAPYGWSFDDEKDTDSDPWTPCERTVDGEVVRGFCRLSCTAKWSYAPERMDCEMLPYDALLARSHSRGLESVQRMSRDSFSKVNSGSESIFDIPYSTLGPPCPLPTLADPAC
jgi:hypothetical protein